MAKATIDVAGMQQLVDGLTSGIETLDAARSAMRTKLQRFNLATWDTQGMQTAADWARDVLPGSRRRLSLAQALEGSEPSWPLGTVQLDDEVGISSTDPDQAVEDGKKAAEALRDGGIPDKALIDEITKNQNDPYFAAGFAGALSADELADVVIKMGANRTVLDGTKTIDEVDEANKWYADLLNGMSTTMATATRSTGDLALPTDYAQSWLRTIKGEVPTSAYFDGGQVDRANALTVLLNSGRYGTPFLNQVAVGVYDYERQIGDERGAVWGPRSSDPTTAAGVFDAAGHRFRDPLAGIMAALGHSPEAAQDFFHGGDDRKVHIDGADLVVSDRLAYLVLDRRWDVDPSNGGALGSALEAATTVLRNSTGTGKVSADIASQTFALIGDKTGDGASDGWLVFGQHEGWKMWDGLRPHVSRMLGVYSADAYRVILDDQDSLEDAWSQPGSGDKFGANLPYGAVLDKALLEKLVGTLGENQDDLTPFLTGMFHAQNLAVTKGLTDANSIQPNAAANFITGGATDDSSPAITNASEVIGWVLDTAYGGDKSEQEFQKKRAEAISDALSLASAIPYIPEIKPKWLAFGVDQLKDATLDGIKDSAPSDAGSTYSNLSEKVENQLRDATLNQLLQSGYFGDAAVAGAAERGYEFRPPPPETILPGPPPHFDTTSLKYVEWYDKSAVKKIIASDVIGVYWDQWGMPE